MTESRGVRAEMAAENTPAASNSNQFVYYFGLPTLQDMASHRIALTIWNNYISSHSKPIADNNNCNRNHCRALKYKHLSTLGIDPDTLDVDLDKMAESLKTPSSIESILKSSMNSIRRRTEKWIGYFRLKLLPEYLSQYWIERFDVNWCHWRADGKIDYAKSGAKMVSGSELNNVQKFVIMSEFCLEEEIKKFSLDSLPKSFVEPLHHRREYLMYYWVRYLKNDLSGFPLGDFDSIDVVMARKCRKPCWEAFEYFWRRLGDDDRISVAEFRINNRRRYMNKIYQERMLSSMSWPQQDRLLTKAPAEMLINFLIQFVSSDAVVWTWNNTKDRISPEQFAQVVIEVFLEKVEFEEGIRLLLEIWRLASDDQRSRVIDTKADEIIRVFFRRSNHCKASFEFLSILLSTKSDDLRREMILENSEHVGYSIDDLDSMEKIIKLCLPLPEDQLEFKSRVIGSHATQSRAIDLFNVGNFEKLIGRLEFYSTGPKAILEFVKRLLTSGRIVDKELVTNFDKWSKFSRFVDEVSSSFGMDDEDVFNLLKMKKQVILSFGENCQCRWNHEGDVAQFRKVVEEELTFDELAKLKPTLLSSFQKITTSISYWSDFEPRQIVEFLSWCLDGDEEKIKEFKKTIPIDEFFDTMIRTGNALGPRFENLGGLNKCLKWYFVEEDLAKVYKIKKMYEFDLDSLCKLLPQYATRPWRELMQELFDGDQGEIRKFGLRQWKHECKKMGMKFPSDGK